MRYLVCFNAFKESLSALELTDIAFKAIKRADPRAVVTGIPIADGGDGTVETLVALSKGTLRKIKTVDPLGRSIIGEYGALKKGKAAVIELAKASGLTLLPPKKRNPLYTSTYGTGLLMYDACKNGAKEIIIGLGGSATTDAGLGIAKAFGYRFYDAKGNELPAIGEALIALNRIEPPPSLPSVTITAASDVKNPLYGASGAAYVYAPQKGADNAAVRLLDKGLRNFARVVKRDLRVSVDTLNGGGAAGGTGAGLVAFFGATIEEGAPFLLRYAKLEEAICNADVVLTGEGAVDAQTAFGKAPSYVSRLCKNHKKPCIILAGGVGSDAYALHRYGVTSLFSVIPRPMTLSDALKDAKTNVRHTIEEIMRLILSIRR